MRTFFAGLLIGILSSALTMFLFYRDTDVPVKDVTVTQVSGEKIEHSGFNYKAETIKFSTHAAGKGEIVTEIPKINIPEARAWMQNNHGVMVELLLLEERNYGLSYLRRWDNFAIGGGVVVSEKNFTGVKVQAQYWFSL